MSDYCNGHTHFWMDDSYSRGDYPCPGPEKCSSSRLVKVQHTVSTPPAPRWDDLPHKS